ncbi:GNAT family N-acetyltransferase [Cohnella nanjingensis]|uniref:GNAT family N-acetyltransferase n=1 Tax=Cohnella nanjingensis TaxID=1387779 RepID=A0A7X0RRY0_9BACL|nr:GNAT family N-acetyltransferase [Cohnella nanjingensis]MBB6672441.1 GNAT family N-acetyltransferase [Cohnella nanjingensis]
MEPGISFGNKEESDYIRRRLIEYNAEHAPENLSSRYEEINLTIKDGDGSVIGGMLAVLCWNWIEVDILWIEESLRGMGYGTRLLNFIENIAKEKNCTFIKLNTFSFQAPEFYLKNGYNEVAVFEDAPIGSNHYYFKKAIV